jgi:hypothetical protein
MREYLTAERKRKTVELLAKIIRYMSIEKEIAEIQSKDYQVKTIEESLAARYAEIRKGYSIDRSMEEEIEQVMNTKERMVENALLCIHDLFYFFFHRPVN